MSLTHETWLRCKLDYISGRGSMREVAARHGIAKSTVEKKARAQDWAGLRSEFEAAQLQKLLPPAAPMLPPAPVAPDGTVSPAWLAQRVEIHYRRNTELLDRVRGLLDAKLTSSEKPTADELGKMVSALSGLIGAEIALLGLNRRTDKKKRHQPQPYRYALLGPEPEPIAEPISEPIPTNDQPS